MKNVIETENTVTIQPNIDVTPEMFKEGIQNKGESTMYQSVVEYADACYKKMCELFQKAKDYVSKHLNPNRLIDFIQSIISYLCDMYKRGKDYLVSFTMDDFKKKMDEFTTESK